ncbi:aldo/keto reductase [Paraliomyxa miuraensis]|uniref:aldo/keto reductase n=1 Tax=Paraliomyxa miuraensis TaxID=376150 RepID=UPI002253F9D5|nr:aldo/keto reductase [Paraliomyxa miuraensis]MCX4241163.1 aldo/keto reductase [Paraliomyxa miuraensis]
MDYRQLGPTGLRVSTLCLGTMTFGEADENSFMHQVGCDERTSFAIMDRALDAGVNFFDTADVYGQDGLSERVIGKWFEKHGRRDEVVLATKFRFVMGKGPNKSGASRYRIVKTVEDSLRRLETDRIDLYQIHMQDIDTPEEETLRALDDLVRQGKVLYLGCSNYAAHRLVDSLWISKTQGLERFVTAQMQYSLVTRDIEREHVSVCREHGLGILPWSPLGAGFLTGKYRKGAPPPEGSRLEKWKDRLGRFDNERNWRILEAVDRVAEQTGGTPSQVALAWLLRKPQVTSVIFGARSLQQLDDNLKAAELRLDDAHMSALDEASAFDLGYPYDFLARVQSRW